MIGIKWDNLSYPSETNRHWKLCDGAGSVLECEADWFGSRSFVGSSGCNHRTSICNVHIQIYRCMPIHFLTSSLILNLEEKVLINLLVTETIHCKLQGLTEELFLYRCVCKFLSEETNKASDRNLWKMHSMQCIRQWYKLLNDVQMHPQFSSLALFQTYRFLPVESKQWNMHMN